MSRYHTSTRNSPQYEWSWDLGGLAKRVGVQVGSGLVSGGAQHEAYLLPLQRSSD